MKKQKKNYIYEKKEDLYTDDDYKCYMPRMILFSLDSRIWQNMKWQLNGITNVGK